jgi:hypothetical protein
MGFCRRGKSCNILNIKNTKKPYGNPSEHGYFERGSTKFSFFCAILIIVIVCHKQQVERYISGRVGK